MDKAFIRLWFQERQVLKNILSSPELRLDREEVLRLVSGEGIRLDELVRADLLSIDGDYLSPGYALLSLLQFGRNKQNEMAFPLWKMAIEQLHDAAMEGAATANLATREINGQRVYELLIVVKMRSEALYMAVQEHPQPPIDTTELSMEFLALASRLRDYLIRSSSFPLWEKTQTTLISWLEEKASAISGPTKDPRILKLQQFDRLSEEEMAEHINLNSLLQTESMMQIERALTIMPRAFLPNQSSVGSFFPQSATPSFLKVGDFERWRESGLHLYAWVQSRTPAEKSIEMFSFLMSAWADRIDWRTHESESYWEGWPSQQVSDS